MSIEEKDFDELMSEHTSTLEDGQKMILEVLLKEIVTYKYETIHQLIGAIENHLEHLNKGIK